MAKPVKIKLLIFLCAGIALCAGCATEPQRSENAGSDTAVKQSFNNALSPDPTTGPSSAVVEHSFNNALFPDCKFSPLQTGVWDRCLVGEEADCVFILSPLVLFAKQRSGVVSLSLIGCHLAQNYGLSCGVEPVVHWANYGILCGLLTGAQHDNYGAQIGVLNLGNIHRLERIQLCGVNVADRLRARLANIHLQEELRSWLNVGLFNFTDSFLDIGLFNVGASTYLQIGVLNYNYNAPIPWMVLFNCSFGEQRKTTTSREDRDDEPDRAFVAPALREKKATDRP